MRKEFDRRTAGGNEAMLRKEYHHWYSSRLNRDIGLVVYGHWGPPLLTFPTSGGDEWEYEKQGMIGALEDFIDAGRVKIFAANSVNAESFYDKAAHPFHRSYVQAQYDAYIYQEVIPFIHEHCRQPGLGISTMGASFGAYHAANTLFKHPDVVWRCFALSGIYDLRRFMDGAYDDNFYFNNPVDYLANLADPDILGQLARCDIHIVTGHGPWENAALSYQLADILTRKGIAHHLDDWGEQGGHDWPYWKNEMREYIGRLFF
jgi:esterase/lipase superfamily enzyme